MSADPSSRFRSTATLANGIAVHAKVWDGTDSVRPPLVLVHGLGLSHRYMMPTAEQLAGHFHVYVPDLPGFGDSGHPETVLDVSALADALLAWMDGAGLARVSLLGNSFACQIIVDFAARYPERVHRAVLQGPTTPPNERSWLWQFVRWRQNAKYNPPELNPITYGDYRRCGYLRALRTFRLSLRDRPESKLPRVTAPTLVVRGEYDPICREEWAAAAARLLPQGRLVHIPGVAHTLVFTAPAQLAEVSRAFLIE